jgi:hypothetical protein
MNTFISDLTVEQMVAYNQVPSCVELEKLDATHTFRHVIFRVEHVVDVYNDDGDAFYTKKEATACRKWLKEFAPQSKLAR